MHVLFSKKKKKDYACILQKFYSTILITWSTPFSYMINDNAYKILKKNMYLYTLSQKRNMYSNNSFILSIYVSENIFSYK